MINTAPNSESDPLPVRNEVRGSSQFVVQAQTILGSVHLHSQHLDRVVPRQLPAAPRFFVGRIRELDTLTATLDDSGSTRGQAQAIITSISGGGGIGKTWLALHWAHLHAERFPDGQLFVDLHGFDAVEGPMSSNVAIRGFLDALGIAPDVIPVDFHAQIALYRSMVAGKQILIILDNARDTNHVLPLLPGSASCVTIVTSRHNLGGIVARHGAVPLDLDVLDDAEARKLFGQHLGYPRVTEESNVVNTLLLLCQGYPLALGIVIARAVTHPNLPLSVIATELEEESTRLDALDTGDLNANLRTVLLWSYQALNEEVATTFCLLGLARDPDIGLPASASLAGLSLSQVRLILRKLEDAHLVQQHRPGRYRMHDLVRLFAAEMAARDVTESRRSAALRRLVCFYLCTAHASDQLLNPYHQPVELEQPIPGCSPEHIVDIAAAMEWFDTEHAGILSAQQEAADQRLHLTVWHLSWALTTFHRRRAHRHHQLACWQKGMHHAQHLHNPSLATRSHRYLGRAFAAAGMYDKGIEHLTYALVLAERASDTANQAHAHRGLAMIWGRQGNNELALTNATLALHLYETMNDLIGQAKQLNAVGWYRAQKGCYAQARLPCQRAVVLARRCSNREVEAAAYDSLGYVARCTGQYSEAVSLYNQALVLRRELGDVNEEALILDQLGNIHVARRQPAQARVAWLGALFLYGQQYRSEAVDRVLRQLAMLNEPDQQG